MYASIRSFWLLAIVILAGLCLLAIPIPVLALDGGTAEVEVGAHESPASVGVAGTPTDPMVDVLPLLKLVVAAARSGEWLLVSVLLLLVVVGLGLKFGGWLAKLNVGWLAALGKWISSNEGKAVLSFLAGFLVILVGSLSAGIEISFGLVGVALVGAWAPMGGWTFWRKIIAYRLEKHLGIKLGTDASKTSSGVDLPK